MRTESSGFENVLLRSTLFHTSRKRADERARVKWFNQGKIRLSGEQITWDIVGKIYHLLIL